MTGKPIAITLGEPSGVGPDIVLALWARHRAELPPLLLLADLRFLRDRAERLGLDVAIDPVSAVADVAHVQGLPVLPLANPHTDEPGAIAPSNAAGTIEAINRACDLALAGTVSAVVTGPIDKKALYDAGFLHPGHTEYIADLCARRTGEAARPVMLLHGPELSCVPVTIHIPIHAVPGALTRQAIEETCRITAAAYRDLLDVAEPRLAIAGLNPHAGEKGAIGHEDEAVIAPAVRQLTAEGVKVVGPLPADTMFHPEARARYDVAICMYHDQALVPAKTLAFDRTVNATIGLPIIRTSPDHGTAATLAGTGTARPDSFLEAIRLASRMAANRAAHV